MGFASGPDMLTRYDARLLGDLVSDNGGQVDATSMPTNAVLLAVLDDASGTINKALYAGDRYTPAQLAALSSTAAAVLRRLCCDLCLLYLKRRRGKFDPEKDGALLKETNEDLKQLREGKDYLMLGVDTEAEASTISVDRPRLVNVQSAQTIRRQCGQYYPTNIDYNMPSSGYPGWPYDRG